jgi:hypothetical protein
MLTRKTDRKVKFDEINKIYFDNVTCKIVHSNNPRYKPGQRVDEAIRFGHVVAKGWEVVPLNHYKLQTEALSVDSMVDIILPSEDEGRYTVFESPDGERSIFVQKQGDKVLVMDEDGKEKFYESPEAFFTTLPEGWVLSGQVDEADLEDEIEGDE